jgi:hypothetical protein
VSVGWIFKRIFTFFGSCLPCWYQQSVPSQLPMKDEGKDWPKQEPDKIKKQHERNTFMLLN